MGPDNPVAEEAAIEQAALAGLQAGSLGPLWEMGGLDFGNADSASNWAEQVGGAAPQSRRPVAT